MVFGKKKKKKKTEEEQEEETQTIKTNPKDKKPELEKPDPVTKESMARTEEVADYLASYLTLFSASPSAGEAEQQLATVQNLLAILVNEVRLLREVVEESLEEED